MRKIRISPTPPKTILLACIAIGLRSNCALVDNGQLTVTEFSAVSANRFNFRDAGLLPASEELKQFVQNLVVEQPSAMRQKRKSQRIPTVMEVPAVMLDEHHQAVGKPFVAVSRNLSAGGLSLVCHDCVTTPCLLVELVTPARPPIQVVARVVRCRSIKRFFEIGCEFIIRVADDSASLSGPV